MAGKNIVICSDGTGNSAVKNRGSNVFKLFEAVDLNSARDQRGGTNAPCAQVAIYDDGVGTGSFRPLRILSGAIGLGLKRNVKGLYADLCRVYVPGDRVFLFGFSRGAFTVRTLAGLISDCGILDADAIATGRRGESDTLNLNPETKGKPCPRSDGRVIPWNQRLIELLPWVSKDDPEHRLRVAVEDAYETHRRNYSSRLSRLIDTIFFIARFDRCKECKRRTFYCRYATAAPSRIPKDSLVTAGEGPKKSEVAVPIPGVNSRMPRRGLITFIGVWDTVDAVGVPFAWLSRFINNVIIRFSFPEHSPSKVAARGCQALSIDDQRQTFHPLVWDQSGKTEVMNTPEDPIALQYAEQVDKDSVAAFRCVVPENTALNHDVIQVWFPGAHSNVGGGYVKQGMSLVPLDWMMSHAEACGLYFIPEVRSQYRALRNEFDKLYDSRAGLSVYYRFLPRDITGLCKDKVASIRIHASTFHRIAQGTGNYAPGNLPDSFEIDGLSRLPVRLDSQAPTDSRAIDEEAKEAERVSGLSEAFSKAFGASLKPKDPETSDTLPKSDAPPISLIRIHERSIKFRRGGYYIFAIGTFMTFLYSLPEPIRKFFPDTEGLFTPRGFIDYVIGWIGVVPAVLEAPPKFSLDASLPNVVIAVVSAWLQEPVILFILIFAVAVAFMMRKVRGRALRKFWSPLRPKFRSFIESDGKV